MRWNCIGRYSNFQFSLREHCLHVTEQQEILSFSLHKKSSHMCPYIDFLDFDYFPSISANIKLVSEQLKPVGMYGINIPFLNFRESMHTDESGLFFLDSQKYIHSWETCQKKTIAEKKRLKKQTCLLEPDLFFPQQWRAIHVYMYVSNSSLFHHCHSEIKHLQSYKIFNQFWQWILFSSLSKERKKYLASVFFSMEGYIFSQPQTNTEHHTSTQILLARCWHVYKVLHN